MSHTKLGVANVRYLKWIIFTHCCWWQTDKYCCDINPCYRSSQSILTAIKFEVFWTLCMFTREDSSCLSILLNETHLLHFCSTGKGTSTHFPGLWFVLRQPRGTPVCSTTVLWSECWVQDEPCHHSTWTWRLVRKACPLHCNKERTGSQ